MIRLAIFVAAFAASFAAHAALPIDPGCTIDGIIFVDDPL